MEKICLLQWVFKGIKQKNVRKPAQKAGSFSCIRVILTGCSPAEPVSASSDNAKKRIFSNEKKINLNN